LIGIRKVTKRWGLVVSYYLVASTQALFFLKSRGGKYDPYKKYDLFNVSTDGMLVPMVTLLACWAIWTIIL
jgi:hypothetical protein